MATNESYPDTMALLILSESAAEAEEPMEVEPTEVSQPARRKTRGTNFLQQEDEILTVRFKDCDTFPNVDVVHSSWVTKHCRPYPETVVSQGFQNHCGVSFLSL